MNKSLEATLRGYLFFSVNGKIYMLYNSALQARQAIDGDVYFKGYHIFKGWRGFYQRGTMYVKGSGEKVLYDEVGGEEGWIKRRHNES
jgi:hypothetical protein